MLNFEYEDFYKFITSIGVALIALSVLVPWLFLKEPFDLLIKEYDLDTLTPLARSIINERLSIISILTNLIPIFSMLVFIVGFVTIIWGGYKWWSKTQTVINKINILNIKILEQKLKELSPDEVKEKRIEEAKAETIEEKDLAVNDVVRNVTMAEEKIINLFKRCLSSEYEVLTNRKIGLAYYDVVLASKKTNVKDIVVELKYIRKSFNSSWLRDNIIKVTYSNQIYQSETNRDSKPLILVIGATNVLKEMVTPEYRSGIKDELKKVNALNFGVLVVLRDERTIDDYTCDEIKETINQVYER